MEKLDSDLLRYVHRKNKAKNADVIKKFGKTRFEKLQNGNMISVETKENGYDAFGWKDYAETGYCSLTDKGKTMLDDYMAAEKTSKLQTWIPIAISLLAIIVSVVLYFAGR